MKDELMQRIEELNRSILADQGITLVDLISLDEYQELEGEEVIVYDGASNEETTATATKAG